MAAEIVETKSARREHLGSRSRSWSLVGPQTPNLKMARACD